MVLIASYCHCASTLASSRGVSIMALVVEAAAPAINTRLQKISILQMLDTQIEVQCYSILQLNDTTAHLHRTCNN